VDPAAVVVARAVDPVAVAELAPRRVVLPRASADVADDESAGPGDVAGGVAVLVQTLP